MAMAIGATSGTLAQLLQSASNSLFSQSGSTASTVTSNSSSSSNSSSNSSGSSSVSDKLKNLLKQAETVQQQADSAIKTGRRDRLSAMNSQITSILNNVSAVVSGLTGSNAAAANVSAALKDNQTAISSVLGTVNSTLSELSVLAPNGADTAASAARTTISQLTSQTSTLARQAGVTLAKATTSTIASGISSRSPHLVDMLV